jgi:hypothetical protein
LVVGLLKNGLTSKPVSHAADRKARNVAAIQPAGHQGAYLLQRQKLRASYPRKKKINLSAKKQALSELTINIREGSAPSIDMPLEHYGTSSR